MTRRRGRTRIAGQFAPRRIEMLESPAHRVLSLAARRVLDRLEIELASHGGKDNGSLVTTYEQFEQFGLDRHSIAPALRELEALGFIEITVRGRGGNAEYRLPNRFRLTYRHTEQADPTEDWRKFATLEEASKAAAKARKAGLGFRASRAPRKKISGVGVSPISVGETHTKLI